MRMCKICGKIIPPESRAKKYCSPECRAKVKYEKDRAWLAAHPQKPREYSKRYYSAHKEACKAAKNAAYRRICAARYTE